MNEYESYQLSEHESTTIIVLAIILITNESYQQ